MFGVVNVAVAACDSGYVAYNGGCLAQCSELTTLHAGTYSYPLFASRTNISSPVVAIKQNGTTCYVYTEADTGGEQALKIRYNNAVYHAVN